MAEVKNSFLSSKMNKDLDDRLIPNSEYRDALNIEVGKSETNNIGVLQNVYGNAEVLNNLGLPYETNPNIETIGIFMDNQNNRIYQFLTDYTDETPSQIILPTVGKEMKITVYDLNTATYSTLVEGIFLNFSKTNLIVAVNLIEGLLFWSENRNQPRKINYKKAINNPNYYTTETQISVAKYAPVEPISLIRKATATVVSGAGDTYVLSNIDSIACTIGTVSGAPTGPYTATVTTAVANGFSGFLVGDTIAGTSGTGSFGVGPVVITSLISSTSITISSENIFSAGTASITLRYPYLGAIQIGSTVVSSTLPGSEYAYVMNVSGNTITLYDTPISTINPGDKLIFLISTMSDQTTDPDWPGDPAFLEDKYVRFSYRFKFDDNEFSLMAPFTQIAYIPRQKGYFINGDETSAYRSTIVKWMENYVNNIELLIPLPDKGLTVNDSYKITDIEILYKESDALAVKVIDTIPWNTIKNTIPNTNIYPYPYQSQKPYKTLNENQTTRVYDIVPTRALSQEIAGNRVIYGNFYNMYSPPATINYNTAVQPKSDIFTNFIEYPNHTLKQNRNYQVGFVLADKFGRQSSVILSSVDLKAITPGVGGPVFGGSTVYAPYQSETIPFPDVRDWFGNALLVLVNDPIASQRNIPQGTPGLYAEPTSPSGFAITAGTISNNTYNFTIDTTPPLNVIPVVGQYMRGEFTDYVEITNVTSTSSFPDPPSGNYVITTTGQVNNLYLPVPPIVGVADIKFAYTINEIGWYSYKVVVKQQQQDYYNAYLPGMLDGYPSGQTFGSQVVYVGANPELENAINTTSFPVGEQGKTSHIVLINDNINKIPRDLTEVGPDQKQYRSSVQLFGRVENTAAQEYLIGNTPYDNKYATTIIYSLVDNLTALSTIKPGDGIQCDQANEVIPNPDWPGTPPDSPTPTLENPDAWYANTVVVSNELFTYTADLDIPAVAGQDQIELTATTYQQVELGDIFTYTISGISYNNTVDGITANTITTLTNIPVTITTDIVLYFTNPNKGIITFSPPNQTRAASSVGPYINFTITRPENTQYFPARKADVVSSIATSTEFNFLDNTVNNVKGSAGLNFYQLQTSPLIGRVTTTKSIGVVSELMVPFLSVYETAPDVSALALFWETASTGLISDLNYDVSTGFDGPSQFGDLVFTFFENQNPNGANTTPGNAESKYITSSFNVLNNTGFPITPDTNPTFDQVLTVSGLDVTSKFDIEEYPTVGSGTWRFIIKDDFVFDHNAPNDSTFNFYIKVTYNSNDYIILYTNRLGNSSPLFVESFPFYNKTIEQVAGSIEFITAENGSHRIPAIPPSGVDNQTDLWWTINSGDVPGYFSIDNTTGELFLLNEDIPLGIYQLEIKVQDAFSTTPLVNVDADYATKEALIDVNITVGPKPVNNYLQRYDTGPFVWEVSGGECISVDGQGYGAVYIGPNDYSLVDHKNAGLPNLMNTTPYSGDGSYQSYVNVEIANGADFIVNRPTGLTQGELQFTIKTTVQGIATEDRRAITNFILYFKEPVAPNNTWQSILDSNNVGSPNSSPIPFQDGVGGNLNVRVIESDALAERSTSLIVSNPTGVPVGEYCLVVWHDYFVRAGEGLECGYDVYSSVQVKDANYDYPNIDTIPPGPAIVPPNTPALPVVPIEYTVQLEEYFTDYPSAIPYDTQDATRTFKFETSAVLAEATTIGSNIIKITTPNAQIVPGIWGVSGQVTDIQIDGVTIILSSNVGSVIPAGTTVTFGTYNHPGSISRTGTVWAATNNPLHITQFYSDSVLSTVWEPPVADKFYLFYNTNRDFDESIVSVPGTSNPTNKPLCCAQFDANGKVIPQTSPNNTIQTAWAPGAGPVSNYGRNLSQFTTI